MLRHSIFYFVFAVLLWGIFRETPPPDLSPYIGFGDKLIHLFAFFIFGLTTLFAFHDKKLLWTVLFLLTMAFGLEYLQGILQVTRNFSWLDSVANGLGVVVSVLTFKALRHCVNK